MKNYFMICGLFLANLCFSQFEVVDKKMDEIPASNEESTLQITDYINSNFNKTS